MSKSFKTFCSANTRICVHLTFHMHFNYILIKDWNGNSLCLSQLGAKNFRWADKMLFFCYCKIHVGAHSPVRTKRKLRRKATWTGSHYIRPPTHTASRELGVEAQRVVDLFEGLLRWRSFDGWFIMVGKGGKLRFMNKIKPVTCFLLMTPYWYTATPNSQSCAVLRHCGKTCMYLRSRKYLSGSLGGNTW